MNDDTLEGYSRYSSQPFSYSICVFVVAHRCCSISLWTL